MQKILITFLGFWFWMISVFAAFEPAAGISDAQIKEAAISIDGAAVAAISHNALFFSRDRGQTFKKIAVFKDEAPCHIFFDEAGSDLYVAAARHVFKFTPKIKVDSLYTANDDFTITTAALYKGKLFVGTTQGMFYADKNFLKWKKLKRFSDDEIYQLTPLADRLLIGAKYGAYIFYDNEKVQKVFETSRGDDNLGPMICSIKADILDKNKVWLATNRELFVSNDKGGKWKALSPEILSGASIYCLGQNPAKKNFLYIGTAQGLLKINLTDKNYSVTNEGPANAKIFSFAFSKTGAIYLATSQGLFKTSAELKFTAVDFAALTCNEPSINELREAALKYNEVHPSKIKRWHQALKYRAFMPKFNVDYAKTMNYDSKTYSYIHGPRDWSAGFSWDIGDLVWNTYEDDVDTRARLDTQMRIDIIDEINRVYFERLRVKRELAAANLSEEESFQRNLRFQELTAALDGYTGGWFSKRAQELQNAKR